MEGIKNEVTKWINFDGNRPLKLLAVPCMSNSMFCPLGLFNLENNVSTILSEIILF